MILDTAMNNRNEYEPIRDLEIKIAAPLRSYDRYVQFHNDLSVLIEKGKKRRFKGRTLPILTGMMAAGYTLYKTIEHTNILNNTESKKILNFASDKLYEIPIGNTTTCDEQLHLRMYDSLTSLCSMSLKSIFPKVSDICIDLFSDFCKATFNFCQEPEQNWVIFYLLLLILAIGTVVLPLDQYFCKSYSSDIISRDEIIELDTDHQFIQNPSHIISMTESNQIGYLEEKKKEISESDIMMLPKVKRVFCSGMNSVNESNTECALYHTFFKGKKVITLVDHIFSFLEPKPEASYQTEEQSFTIG